MDEEPKDTQSVDIVEVSLLYMIICLIGRIFVAFCYFEGTLSRPTPDEYEVMAQKLCDAYPCLKTRSHTKYWHNLQSQITQRYRNNRRGSQKSMIPKVSLPPRLVSSSPQPQPEEEQMSDNSYLENVNALMKLSEARSVPAPQVIHDLLDATRAGRKSWLQGNISVTKDILETYPCFGKSRWLLYEFRKLCEGTHADVCSVMSFNWYEVCKLVLGDRGKNDLDLKAEIETLSTIDQNIYHKRPAFLPISFILGAEIDDAIAKVMEPRLLVVVEEGHMQQMFVSIEGDMVVDICSEKLVDGLIHLMASYYVFDVSYPTSCKSSLLFFQDFLMKMPDKARRPTRYVSYIDILNSK
jgi:hypothetical protein